MKKIGFFLSIIVVGIGVSAANNQNKTEEISMISRASFGTKASRVQFHKIGKKMKISYNVGGYDVTTGPTFKISYQEGNKIIYTNDSETATVSLISQDDVTISFPNNGEEITTTFTGRGKDLGMDPQLKNNSL